MTYAQIKPQLRCQLEPTDTGLTVTRHGSSYDISGLPISPTLVSKIFTQFNGERAVSEVIEEHGSVSIDQVGMIIDSFHESGFLIKNVAADSTTGLGCLLELEDLQNKLMYETLYENVFWTNCQNPEGVPQNVFYGMAIENYHFLFRESWFDAPILGLPGSIDARVLMNEFFCEEYGHDELILKSLNELGITREEIYRTVPLPETLALCNALAHWAATDPLFFFSTMGVLEGKDLKIDSYVSAMEGSEKIDDKFIKYIRDHSNINLNDGHGNLSREIFKKFPIVSLDEVARLKSKTHLFIEIYDRFYSAIWNHYSNSSTLLRLIEH